MARGTPDWQSEVRQRFTNSVEHKNGTVGTTKATVSFANPTRTLVISNTSLFTLYVSFDSGATWLTIAKYGNMNVDVEVSSVDVKGSAAGTTYEIVATEEAE